ncbi:MAG TPA: ATP-dependent DNA helicase RecG, partial [Bacteroidota bacterium]|nr:ATP-dependent DNA helicase RecG [Bacteroidota bacterium]
GRSNLLDTPPGGLYLGRDMQSPAHPSDLHSVPVKFVKGIGPKKSALLEEAGIRTVEDLLLHVPRRYIDRTTVVSIAELLRLTRMNAQAPGAAPGGASPEEPRREYTAVGEVRSFRVLGFGAKSRFVLVLADRTGSLQCVWFGGVGYWKNMFRVGETLAVSGEAAMYGGVLQFVHPDIDRMSLPAGGEEEPASTRWVDALNTGGLVPMYPSGQDLARAGLDSGGLRRVIAGALRTYGERFPEILPREITQARRLIPARAALQSVHHPASRDDLRESLRRLKYEELFRFQLKLAMKRRIAREESGGIAFDVRSPLARALVDTLPFELTRAQVRVVREITADMAAPKVMNRLLQGDVGSGKTVVALIAMLIAVSSGYQSVFMAPTELLAEQHFRTLRRLLGASPVTIRLLVGAQKSALRRDVLDDIREGTAQIVVGTHALFEKEVAFARLGFVVIDEQHRFGVMQRATLRGKGVNPDVLVMTATPIPRTLSLTLYGDLDVSVIDELPADRKPVTTVLKSDADMASVASFVREQVRAGRQAYYVYPLIEESEKLDLKAATVHYNHLQNTIFPDLRLGLIHGRLSGEERDAVMERFTRREIDILVATTVIEVGIDVSNATVMVIENAERFGLSQLHQLRGRVGRGSDRSFCILVAKRWIAGRASRAASRPAAASAGEQLLAERRLAAMVSTTDGFRIAETDLQIRGPGDFFGTRQSGMPEFKIADIIADAALLADARDDAFAIVADDPHLAKGEHRSLLEYLRSRYHDEMKLLDVG